MWIKLQGSNSSEPPEVPYPLYTISPAPLPHIPTLTSEIMVIHLSLSPSELRVSHYSIRGMPIPQGPALRDERTKSDMTGMSQKYSAILPELNHGKL